MSLRAYQIACFLALASFSAACIEDRTRLPPDQAFLGHWVRDSVGNHYYISQRGITETTPAGRVLQQGFYTIVKQVDLLYRELTIEARFEAYSVQRVFRFAPDGRAVLEVSRLNPLTSPLPALRPLSWTYVDNRQQP